MKTVIVAKPCQTSKLERLQCGGAKVVCVVERPPSLAERNNGMERVLKIGFAFTTKYQDGPWQNNGSVHEYRMISRKWEDTGSYLVSEGKPTCNESSFQRREPSPFKLD